MISFSPKSCQQFFLYIFSIVIAIAIVIKIKIHEAQIIFINYGKRSELTDVSHYSSTARHSEWVESPSLNHYHYSISFNTNVTFFIHATAFFWGLQWEKNFFLLWYQLNNFSSCVCVCKWYETDWHDFDDVSYLHERVKFKLWGRRRLNMRELLYFLALILRFLL